jgi:uncharacterized protein DUF6338
VELSKFSIGLIFIFLPGVLALLVSERLTEHPERKNYELFVYALVLGCIAHIGYGLLAAFSQTLPPAYRLDEDRWIELMLDDSQVTIQTRVVAGTAIIGVLLGFVLAYAANHSWLQRVAHALRVSRKFADNDVWGYLMNPGKVGWIVVRDQPKNLMYQGYVATFSTTEDPRELILRDAPVFENSSGKKLYDVASLYLSFEKKDVVVEIFQ